MRTYDTVIGLEIHVALWTRSKIFCGCSTAFGAPPNSQCCPICLGLPGTLPVLNEQAIAYAIKAGLALDCQINSYSKFDRKNYFYPDLPKAYQISQDNLPLCTGGYLEYYFEEQLCKTNLIRIHVEEEAGKLVHSGSSIVDSAYSLVDYNRAGIPLIEIVTAPDLPDPEQARVFLEQLRLLLSYAGVSDTKMEEGSLRCDANISLKPKGSTVLGTKVEIKNLNSFRAVERALKYEEKRQREVLEQGGIIGQESRTWDERAGRTMVMRSKGDAVDYRFFAEPDLPPLTVEQSWILEIKESIPELPLQRLHRLMETWGLSSYEATFLVNYPDFADLFSSLVGLGLESKAVINLLMGDYARLAREHGHLEAQRLAGLLEIMAAGVISLNRAKDVLEELFCSSLSAKEIVSQKGWEMLSDAGQIQQVVLAVIAENPEIVQRYLDGETKLWGFLVGQVMRASKGKADPELVNELLRKEFHA